MLDSECNEEWDDWYDDGKDEFTYSDPEGVLKDIAGAADLLHECLDKEMYKEGADLAEMLSVLTVQVSGDYYGDVMSVEDLVDLDLLDIALEKVIRESICLAYMGNDAEKKAEAIGVILDNYDMYSVSLEEILRTIPEEVDLNAFLPS